MIAGATEGIEEEIGSLPCNIIDTLNLNIIRAGGVAQVVECLSSNTYYQKNP
jgi:hypothetical protein